jgi:GT2 family glycosyltransferase
MRGQVIFMKLFIVVLCYRVPDLTVECLRSLNKEVGRVPGTKVAVCENGTGGDAADQLGRAIDEQGWSSWCELTVVHPNRGFCEGNNLVIRPVLESDDPPEYVLLLNADTMVLDHSLATLVDFMDSNPSAGIAGSQLLSPEGKVQGSPFRFLGILTELERGLRLGIVSKLFPRSNAVPPTPVAACPVDWVSGASMILRG